MPKSEASITAPVEDYLKTIYELERGGGNASTTEIAERLAIAPPSVSGMVRRLAEMGLVTHEPYRGVRLTEAGRLAALRTLRRHRLLEAYLVQALGYGWDEVHAEAERLEHAASDELIDRMAAAIGEPKVDPHGAPIPSREGAVDEARYATLAEMAVGESAEFMRVDDDNPELLRYLDQLALRPGALVVLRERAPFGGPITLEVNACRHAIGLALAERLLVRPPAAASA